ncbi:hypothetical protein UFOVP42_58 [uncultured Caudovirales phage]|uniref:Uncharacterized protein n=1 Tax=uncultured Caudovirales phage TaxID=2100421 RepID=A0A6J5KQA9_9CAUD|nr:hypothetical protein UFOVP42_58 [uncultured Caudovirales phage]
MNIKDIKVTFEHTTGELELLLAGLRKLPMELVQKLHDEMIAKANASVAEQVAKAKQTEETVAVGVTPVETE